MNKIVYIVLLSFVLTVKMNAAPENVMPTPTPYKAKTALEKIQEKVSENMEKTKGIDKPFETKNVLKAGKEKMPVISQSDENVTLFSLNIVDSMFVGAVTGLGVSLYPYGKGKNMNANNLIWGSAFGAAIGMVSGLGVSLVEINTKKFYAGDDLQNDILGGAIVGGLLGSCGGIISYAKTQNGDNITEGAGIGIIYGASAGLVLAVIEFVLPSQYRGRNVSDKKHALMVAPVNGGYILSANARF